MNIFTIEGIISIFNKGANKAIDETGQKANGLANTMEKAFAKIGNVSKVVGKAAVAGLAASTAAMGALMKKSIGNYADYEQLVGGVQTLFGDDAAKTVMENAQKAFQTAGMSANAYMETVTGFSASLVASLKGDTVKAADAADMALRDMSDNANKMGTDMTLIQNAYQGFAKQNYTMLDNLKLGYGGTQSEMKRLLKDAEKIQKAQGNRVKYSINSFADIVEAIHVVQDEMGITGTTAAEANDTISGSLSSTKAAWENLVTGLADGNQDLSGLITSFVDSAKIAVKNITKVLPDLVSGFSQLIDGLSPEIPGILQSILPSLIQGALSLFSGLASALPGLIGVIIDQIPYILDQVGAAISTAWTGIVWPAIQSLFKTVFGVELPSWSELVSSIQSGWDTVKEVIKDFFMTNFGIELPSWSEVVSSIKTGWETIREGIKDFFKAYFSIALPFWSEIISAIQTGWETIKEGIKDFFLANFGIELPSWSEILTSIKEGWENNILPFIKNYFSALFSIELPDFDTMVTNIKDGWNNTVWPAIQNYFSTLFSVGLPNWFTLAEAIDQAWTDTLWPAIQGFFKTMFDVELPDWQTIIDNIDKAWTETVWPTIQGFFKTQFDIELPDWESIKQAFESFKANTIDPLIQKWVDVKTKVSEAFDTVKNWLNDKFSEPMANFKNNVVTPLADAWSVTVSDAINSAKQFVQDYMGIDLVEGWDEVTNAIKSAWDTVVGIINNAISAVQSFLGLNKEASSVGFGGGTSSGNGAGRSFGDNSKSSGGSKVAPASMRYNASGAVFSKPTIFDTRLGYQVAGEAGPEAIAPIGVLQKYVSEAVASQNAGLITALHEIRDALMDMDDNMGGHMRDALDGTALNVNKREFARLVKVVE